MVYQNNLVATIKIGGKILREDKETVAVPFGAEYSIYLKNLSTVRALVRVSVDGQDATENVWLIVPAKGSLELERFIKNGDMEKGNKFKFIERTGQIENFRGIGAEDGLINIEYKFEAPQPQNYIPSYTIWNSNGDVSYGGQGTPNFKGGQSPLNINTTSVGSASCYNVSDASTPKMAFTQSSAPTPRSSFSSKGMRALLTRSAAMKGRPAPAPTRLGAFRSFDSVETSAAPQNENGITVAGSESRQKFGWGDWFPTEDASHTLVLKLVGKVGNQPVVRPVTVEIKPTCTTCGRVNKATNKFCSQCGTSLVLL